MKAFLRKIFGRRPPRHERKFQPRMPVYPVGDPRIEADLRQGAGVGIDYGNVMGTGKSLSELKRGTPEEQALYRRVWPLAYTMGPQTLGEALRDPVAEANHQMMPDNLRYPQDGEEDGEG